MLRNLAAISAIATTPPGSLGATDVVRACELVRELMGAEDAYIVRAGDPYFIRLESDEDPREYEIKQRGYWVIWKALAGGQAAAGIFTVADRLVDEPRPCDSGGCGTHAATILPGNESNSEILIVRGPFPQGLSAGQCELLATLRPILGSLISNFLDSDRQARQRKQLGALADVAAAFSESKDMTRVLEAVATALAKASGFDWVNVYLMDDDLTTIVDRAQNLARYSSTATAQESGSNQTDVDRDGSTLRVARRLDRRREPYLVPDVFGLEVSNEFDVAMRRFYERAHILSVGTFPILFQERVIGIVVFSSSTPRRFERQEVEFLTALVSQAATTVRGLQLSREFQEADQQLRAIFANAPVLITVFDADGMITLMEGAALASIEDAGKGFVGRSAFDLTEGVSRSLASEIGEGVARCLTGESYSSGGQVGGRYYETRYAPLRDEDGLATGAIAVSDDITDRRQAEQELRELNVRLAEAHGSAMELAEKAEASARAKSEFIANTSHEIRTPMNGVMGMTSLLLDTHLSSEQREYVETIRDSADALLTVIDEILDFSKLEAGKMRIDVDDFDLRTAIEEVTDLLAPVAQRKGLELTVSMIPPDFPSKVRGDAGRLRQVLVNLLGNAIKFTDGGEVGVKASVLSRGETEVAVRLAVRDTGIGISEERQAAIFDSFTQADGTSTRRYGGTGLGLTISKQIVELMGGKIGVDSTPGCGSTFWVEVVFELQANSEARLLQGEPLLGRKVLVVDDNATNRLILREQLLAWGCGPVEARSGEEALELLESAGEEFGLVLMDFQMPDLDGRATTTRIKRDLGLTRLPVVLLSSAGMQFARDIGPNSFAAVLMKPVRQSSLYNTLIEVLSKDGAKQDQASRGGALPVKPLGLRVLLAEDNPINQKVALRMLERWGCEVDVVGDGQSAVAAIETASYDAVLMDCHMPGLDGYEATLEIRRLERLTGEHVPIIAMTANALDGDRDRCLSVGMDDYVRKPVKPEDLWKALYTWSSRAGNMSGGTTRLNGAEALVLDEVQLRETCGDDAELMSEIRAEFSRTAPDAFARVAEAAAAGDTSGLVVEAHTFKGSCWALGAVALGVVLARIEAMAKSGDLSSIPELMVRASVEHTRLLAALAECAELRAA
jgi:PAS domain S-box-containing protein